MSTSDHTYSNKLNTKRYHSKRYCCVPQCNKKNIRGNTGVSVHAFPRNISKKRQWEIVLKMGKKTPKNAVVCLFHFQDEDFIISQKKSLSKLRRLKENVIPSLNLPKRKLDTVIDTPRKEKMRKRSERAQKRSKFVEDLFNASNELEQTQEQTSSDFEDLATELVDEASVQISNK